MFLLQNIKHWKNSCCGDTMGLIKLETAATILLDWFCWFIIMRRKLRSVWPTFASQELTFLPNKALVCNAVHMVVSRVIYLRIPRLWHSYFASVENLEIGNRCSCLYWLVINILINVDRIDLVTFGDNHLWYLLLLRRIHLFWKLVSPFKLHQQIDIMFVIC